MKYLKCLFPLFFLAATGCTISLNKSVDIPDGETRSKSINIVNGNITIGKRCEIRGSARTVNGSIEVGEGSVVSKLETVNGPITIGRDVLVRKNIRSINGSVQCASGVLVKGDVCSINGAVALQKTRVRGDVCTTNADVTLRDHSEVLGDILVEKVKGDSRTRTLMITIADSSVVEGGVFVEGEKRNVSVVLKTGGQVKGKIRGAEIVREDSASDF